MAGITAKSLEEWRTLQLDKWLELEPNINTNIDSMVSMDASVIAEVAYLLEQDLITQTNNAFLAYASGDELSNLGDDRGIPRKVATVSTGYVSFKRETKATGNYVISEGTTVATEENSEGIILAFKTTEVGTLYGSIETPTGLSNVNGTSGGIGDGTYNYTITAITGDNIETDESAILEVVISNGNTNNNISLSWSPVLRAASYNIYLGGLLLGTSTDNTFNDLVGTTSSTITPPLTNETGNTSVEIPIKSAGTGAIYNVGIGSIIKLIETPTGIESIINDAPISGGSDKETDIIYRARIQVELSNNVGKVTATGYENTALAISGVATATAIHEAGNPVNEISVFITASDIDDPIPTQILLDEVTLELNSDDNRAVCDTIIAKAPSIYLQDIEVNITSYENLTYSETQLTDLIRGSLISYLTGLPMEDTVRVVGISNAIHDTNGVIDFDLLTPNTNYTLGAITMANLGLLTVNYT